MAEATTNTQIAIGAGSAVYDLNHGGANLVVGQPLVYAPEMAGTAEGDKGGYTALPNSAPPGFVVTLVHNDAPSGLNMFVAYNKDTNTAVVGIAGINGVLKLNPGSAADTAQIPVGMLNQVASMFAGVVNPTDHSKDIPGILQHLNSLSNADDGNSGNSLNIISRQASNVYFDTNGDGLVHHTGWVGPHDALVVEDLNGDGKITYGAEIAFASRTAATDTDLQALMTLHDTNGDGKITADDVGVENLKLWIDANSNGVSDAGELQTFAQAGLTSLSGTRRLVNYVGGEVEISAMSTATFDANGQSVTHAVADVSFNVEAAGYRAVNTNPDGSTTVKLVDGRVWQRAV